jgi:hypothetical protein
VVDVNESAGNGFVEETNSKGLKQVDPSHQHFQSFLFCVHPSYHSFSLLSLSFHEAMSAFSTASNKSIE